MIDEPPIHPLAFPSANGIRPVTTSRLTWPLREISQLDLVECGPISSASHVSARLPPKAHGRIATFMTPSRW
jgi:hypothetical protein